MSTIQVRIRATVAIYKQALPEGVGILRCAQLVDQLEDALYIGIHLEYLQRKR